MLAMVESVQKKPRFRRQRVKPRLVVVQGGRELSPEDGQAELLRVSSSIRAKSSSPVVRPVDTPDRRSVAHAMLMVEIRLVKAFWTIARQPLGKVAPLSARRNGIEYYHDRQDVHARYADAAGGKWESAAPRPALPSSKAIDEANEALDWLLFIPDEGLRRLLVVGATSKRGEIRRGIPWPRLRPSLPSYGGVTVRTMQRHYLQALRIIVTEMTLAHLSHLSHK